MCVCVCVCVASFVSVLTEGVPKIVMSRLVGVVCLKMLLGRGIFRGMMSWPFFCSFASRDKLFVLLEEIYILLFVAVFCRFRGG